MSLQFNWRMRGKKQDSLYFRAILFPCFAERTQPCGEKQFQLSSKKESHKINIRGTLRRSFRFIRFYVERRLQAMMKNEKSQQNFGAVFFFAFVSSMMGSEKGHVLLRLKKKRKEDFIICFPSRDVTKLTTFQMKFVHFFLLTCGWKLMEMFGHCEFRMKFRWR